MILIDTHIWFWWVRNDPALTSAQRSHIAANQSSGIAISVISVLEIARLEFAGRVNVFRPIDDWVKDALNYPGVRLIDLSTEIAPRPQVSRTRFTRTRPTASSWPRPGFWESRS